MLSRFLLSQILLPTLAFQVAATEYCQCQNPTYGHRFGGIQQKCKDLSNDWCSTNCNFFGSNCDYCQFQPAGHGPDADYQQLKKWCYSQKEWDAAKQVYFQGSDVICYSAKNAVPKEFGNTGCEHQDNDNNPRDKTAFLRIKLKGGWYERRGCSNLTATDWSSLAAGVRKRNNDCEAINNNTIQYTIDCPYTPTASENEKRKYDFKYYCEQLKGHWYLRDNGPNLLEADMMQQPLAIPGRYPPKLPSSLERETVVNEDLDEAWTIRVDHAREVGSKAAVHGGGVSSDGKTEVVFEEDDVTITVVAEDL